MNSLNSRFAEAAGGLPSAVAIHATGLAAVSLLLALRKEARPGGRPPFYLYAGGIAGVGTVLACNVAFSALGPALATALALLGQTAASILADATGFLGRERRPLAPRSLPGLALALAGIAAMAGRPEGKLGAVLLGLAAGVFPLLSTALNARLGAEIGLWRGVRANFAAGLGATLALALATGAGLAGLPSAVALAGPLVAFGGAFLGLVAVGSLNVIFPRIPALASTLLLFAGQALAGLALDSGAAQAGGAGAARKVLGTALLLAGLAANALLEGRAPRGRAAREKRRPPRAALRFEERRKPAKD